MDLERKELIKESSLRWELDKMIIDYLRQNYLFEEHEIKHNIEVFKEAYKSLDLMRFLAQKKRLAATKKNPKGYLINALRSELKTQAKKKVTAEPPAGGNPEPESPAPQNVSISPEELGKIVGGLDEKIKSL